MKNPKCWARCLDNCSTKMSGEHRISNRAWTLDDPGLTGKAARRARDRIPVSFERGAATANGLDHTTSDGFRREITVGSTTVNNLCTTHNSELGDTDAAAGALTDAVAGYRRTIDERRGSLLRFVPSVFDVDGPCIERWFLKTAISNLVDDGRRIGSPDAEVDAPADALVRMVFGKESLAPGVGMWAPNVRDGKVRMPEVFTLQAIARPATPEPYLCACAFTFRGLMFVAGLDLETPISSADVDCLVGWKGTELIRPLTFISDAATAAVIRFTWPGIEGSVH